MAELASGAVTSLLGVLRNEWVRLGRVGDDVQFIREEMESMSSFLMHLTRAVPPGGEHDEQVRTWMNQVRQLAQDCNNCIDLYLYRGDREIHLGKAPLGRYLRWVPWFLQKMLAQHRAASELVKLKERARDVGERRTRYGVEVPKVAAASEGGGVESLVVGRDDGGHEVAAAAAVSDGSGRIRRALFGHYDLEDYFNDKLTDWIKEVRLQWCDGEQQHKTRCVTVLVPSTEDSGAIAREASSMAARHVKNIILVDIPALHIWSMLGPKNILYYILREIELQKIAKSQSQKSTGEGEETEWMRKKRIRKEKRVVIGAIKKSIEALKVVDKIQEINTDIQNVKDKNLLQSYLDQSEMKEDKDLGDKISNETSLGVLLILLVRSAAAADETKESNMPTLAEYYKTIVEKTANKLKDHMDKVNKGTQRILHHVTQYEHILHEVFPKIRKDSKHRQQAQEKDVKQATSESTSTKDQIREIIDKVKQEILSEVFMAISDNKGQQATKTNSTATLEDKSSKKQETSPADGPGPTAEALPGETKQKDQLVTGSNPAPGLNQEHTKIVDAAIKETIYKMRTAQTKIKRQLDINGIVEKIQNKLNNEETVVILKVDEKYVYQWEHARNALSLLPKVAVVMILTKTEKNKKRVKEEYCYQPDHEPIDYSLAALYHYIVLLITNQQKNEDSYDPQILRTILDKCEPNEFCMKIFVHALYSNPKRSKEELQKLNNSLQVLPPKLSHSNALEMFKFSYRDMPKEYQSCLLYLAIFPRGHNIRRSTLIGRWVAEGLITTEDWRWSSSVHKADKCFKTLVTKWLVYSTEVSVTGRFKSCMVGDLVHEFITEIAKKQRIVETRLSHHLARHFSIFNDIHLRGSEKIKDFLHRLPEPSQWSRIKVLDLEGCQCFKKNQHYLKNICNNILLLKYLSLRGTDVTQLPREINNLRELEVLDIQQTEVQESATRDLLLLKLKRLLAGHTHPSPSSTGIGTSFPSHVLVPEKIEKMLEMEVLSNVKAKSSQDLSDIGKLWQLRKLGVVIKDKVSHVNKIFEVISNLSECLWSLSIALDVTRCNGTHNIDPAKLKNSPKFLERLSISGNILHGHLLPLLLKKVKTTLIKVTLSNTKLNQDNLVALSKLPMLRCLRLRHNTYDDNKLTFKNDFEKLIYFLVESSNKIEISFEDKSAPELKKIVLFLDNIETIAGVHQLRNLEELELNNNNKSSNNNSNIGGTSTTATAAIGHATSALGTTIPFPVTTTPNHNPLATNPAPFDDATNGHTRSTATAAAATNPSTLVATGTTTIPSSPSAQNSVSIASPSAPSATNATAIPPALTATTIPSSPSATNSIAIPSSLTTTIPSAPSAPNAITNASPSAPTTTNATTIPSAPSATNATATPSAPTVTNADTIPSPHVPTSTNSATIPSPSAPNTTNAATIPSTPTATNIGASTIRSPSPPTISNDMFSKLLFDAKHISRLTLRGTMLKQDDIQLLARMENIRYMVLLEGCCDESQLALSKDEFPKLNILIVDCSTITGITFNNGSCPKLKKIVWTFANMNFFGIENLLPRLKELEFKGDSLPKPMKEVINKYKDKINYTHYKPESATVENPEDDNNVSSCLFIWKDKGWRRKH